MNTKTITPENIDTMGLSDLGWGLRPDQDHQTPAVPWTLLLGAYMISTAPEFAHDGRRHVLDAATVEKIGRLLEKGGIDIARSIDIALDRAGATA